MNSNKNSVITFIFGQGRVDKLNKVEYSTEFFYSYDLFLKEYANTQIIEFETFNNFINKYILNYFDRIMSKIFKLGFTTRSICKIKNFKKIINTDYLILVNERIAIASLPMIMLVKIFKPIKINLIVMGLFSKDIKSPVQKFFHKGLIKLIIFYCDNLIFLGIGEYNESKKFTKIHSKLHFVPFCINTSFWSHSSTPNRKDSVIFIGNDGNRDYEKTLSIAKNLKEINFNFITKNITESSDIPANVNLISGHWNESLLTDFEIKNLYEKSLISIVPLHDTLQPSGQSVTMQSMSMGVPVIISKTIGFWENKFFEHGKNIILMEDNSLENWTETVKSIYEDKSKRSSLSRNGRLLVQDHYSINEFFLKLKSIIFN